MRSARSTPSRAGDDREIDAARGRQHPRRAFEVIASGSRSGSAATCNGSQAGWPARAGADVDSSHQGGRGRARPEAAGRPGSRVHDEIVPTVGRPRDRLARPTNNAGGLEGGVTNGEDLRVSAWMKPISTLMKPLRSVDLTTMTEAQAAIERSDVCAVPRPRSSASDGGARPADALVGNSAAIRSPSSKLRWRPGTDRVRAQFTKSTA